MYKAVLSLALIAVAVVAQAPDYTQIPAACSSSCASTIKSADLCATQYSSSLNIYGCFCTNLPTDISSCSSCLSTNNAAALGTLITQAQTGCPSAISSCFFQCSFDTCPSTDVACQCNANYLENIYNCASCNSANGNTKATLLADFQALNASCANQNYTGPFQAYHTVAIASATGQNNYVAPTLTGTGGGAAATGTAAGAGGAVAGGSNTGAVNAGGAVTGSAASITGAVTGTSTPTTVAGVAASGGVASSAKSGSTAAAAATTSAKSGASALVIPFGTILAIVAGISVL